MLFASRARTDYQRLFYASTRAVHHARLLEQSLPHARFSSNNRRDILLVCSLDWLFSSWQSAVQNHTDSARLDEATLSDG